MLLVEKTGVYLQNGEDSVGFKDLDELKFYTGVDLTQTVGGTRVGYEPDRGMHTEFDGSSTTERPVPYTIYDQLLAQVSLYTARKTNPLYGLTGVRLFEAQKRVDESEVRRVYEEESEAPVVCLGHTWNGGQDSASYIQGAVNLAQALGESTVTITDIANVGHTMSFADALAISATIGKAFRDAFFKKQAALVEINGRVFQ